MSIETACLINHRQCFRLPQWAYFNNFTAAANINRKRSYMELAIDVAIRIGVLALLIAWCFQILRPFITPVIWGTIIAIALYPVCSKLSSLLGNRIKLAAAIMTLTILLLIILPCIQMVGSLVDEMTYLNGQIQSGDIKVPPPPENIDSWPVIAVAFIVTIAAYGCAICQKPRIFYDVPFQVFIFSFETGWDRTIISSTTAAKRAIMSAPFGCSIKATIIY